MASLTRRCEFAGRYVFNGQALLPVRRGLVRIDSPSRLRWHGEAVTERVVRICWGMYSPIGSADPGLRP